MSEEGDYVTFPWKNPSWDFANPDNSGNVGDRLGKKIACSSSHARAAAEKEPDPVPTRKRSRDMIKGQDKNGQGELAANGGKTVGESDHEIHIWTERERRKRMRNMFANLHALLPHVPPKADKSTIVDEAVNHIKNLENTLQNLQKQKHEKYHCTAIFNCEPSTAVNSQSLVCDSREAFLASQGSAGNLPLSAASSSASSPVFRHPIAFQTWSSPNIVLNICGDEAMISICSPKKPGLFTGICYVLEKHKIQVVSAQMSSDYSRSLYMIQAQVAGASDQQAEVLPVEEIYKQAVTEIMVWTSS
ncbi:transcription factor bHLH95 [Syzygium oleosum]|uniref:transcription factor bHLH95 n=1 Tax=Syzygium oleosum TaxID=219896 RepID=UPI0024BAF600|nr:transcription factor bHLH95 [Syzygium oleosum]